MRTESVHHHFTVDVEEYFQVSAFEAHVHRSAWDRFESRVERSMELILDMLDRFDAKGTFFTLGWIAERHPSMVRSFHERGHEVASHGQAHQRVTDLTPDEFRDSVRTSKDVLEQTVGSEVVGYRAPSYSIVPGREWALDVLLEEGYRYDSSLFPVKRPGYGYPHGARDPYWVQRPAGRLAEVPPATLRWAGVNVPASGGAYLRLFPFAVIRRAFIECERRGQPGTFYIHPWEVDPEQPRMPVPLHTRLRHYGGLARTAPRLERLLAEFAFQPVLRSLDAIPAAKAVPVGAG